MNVFGSVQSLVLPFVQRTDSLLIDFGSANTRIYFGGTMLFHEPTCVAVHTRTQSVIAIGEKALKLLGKTPSSVVVSFPIIFGEIAHTQNLEYFLTAVLRQIVPELQLKRYILGLSATIAIPGSLAPAKKMLLQQVLKTVGFTKIIFVESGFVIAKSIAKRDPKLKDICVLDLGAQKTEISIFSLGELIASESYKWGGIYLTELLQSIIRSKYQCVVGWQVAETAKKEIGSVVASKEKIAIQGKDLISQASKTVIIDAGDVKTEFASFFSELLDTIQQFIALLPSEVAVSVLDKGIYITGGTSQINGIDQFIIEKFKCDVLMSTQPQKDVSIGLQSL